MTVLGHIKKIDELTQNLSLTDGTRIPMADLVELNLTEASDLE